MADDQAQNARVDELASALNRVRENPTERARWERVEELLDSAHRPGDVSELFHAVMAPGLASDLAGEIGSRGVRFYETWYGEDSAELARFLERVLLVDPQAQWAFERLTVAHTVAERWSSLLDAFDRALSAADETARRMRLLEEAAQVAKDFASDPERAIGYMLKLHALDPDNAALAAALERLLERRERWEDLVSLWKSRLSLQSLKQAREARVRMANCYLDKLGRYGDALEQAKLVLNDAPEHADAYDVLERVLSADRAGGAERREALLMLKQRFLDAQKPGEVVRVLELGLRYANDAEQRSLLRELCERLVALSDDTRAMAHQAQLLALEPTGRERDALHALAERTRDFALYADALCAAADRAEHPATAAELRIEAARTCEQVLADEARACQLYAQVFSSEAQLERVVEAGRALLPLLEQTAQEQPLLEALSRMSELEADPGTKRSLLGRIARLASKLGDRSRADLAWQSRLQDDAQDLDALAALIASATEDEEWQKLAELLEQRVNAPAGDAQRRKDLKQLATIYADRIADIGAAIGCWRRLEQGFGQDLESVDALTDLLSRAEQWHDLADVLSDAAQRQVSRFTELQTRLGDAYRERLDQPELAAERYRSALSVDPRDEAALRGQHVLMQDDRCRAIAVQSLSAAYAETGLFQKTLELLEARLSIEAAPARRAELLTEAARLYEQRSSDPRAALACLRRAFALCPDDRATQREIRRLAEQLSAYDAVVAAYRETIASLGPKTPRAAELRFDEARTLEDKLNDPQAALSAYAEAAALQPDRIEFALAATRVAAQLGRWEAAARHALDGMATRGVAEPKLVEVLESAARAERAFDGLCEAMTLGLRVAALRLPATLCRELHARVAGWHREHRNDETAAEASLLRAVAADARHAETLQALAEMQRRAPNEALCDTLLALFDLDPQTLDPLLEAAEIAGDAIADRDKRLGIFERLYERGAELLRSGGEPRGQASAAHCTRFALERLVAALTSAENAGPAAAERAYGLLVAASALPFDADHKRDDLHAAAKIAAATLKDPVRALGLYRDLLQSDPLDREAVRELGKLYQAGDRLPELLMLRRHELSLEREIDRQLELRLDIARILGEIEARGGRAQALLDNLRVRPGHPASLDALAALYALDLRHAELAELLRKQAEQLAKLDDQPRAAQLLARAAAIYEHDLSNPDAAIATYKELYDLDPVGTATAALARLHAARGDHGEAARWLEQRLLTAPADTRAITAVELGQALLEAGQRERARTCLEQALQSDPSLRDARELLFQIYRRDGAHEPLAGLLVETATHEPNERQKLALLSEAANLYCDQLHAPERALTALGRAVELAPGDRALAQRLAEALSAAGRHAEARAAFDKLIEGFGKKRSPERAELHYRAGRAAHAAGDLKRAEEELETATKMDLGHAAAMHMLAELSLQQSDLDRAERTYRGLLMLVRRQKSSETGALGPSQIFFALGRIAATRGQQTQADELLESAMEAATQNDVEARRFQEELRKAGETALLMRVLDARLTLAHEPQAQAEVWQAKASVLADSLNKPKDALSALLSALALAPDREGVHTQARKLASSLDELDRYLDRVSTLSDEASRKRDDASQELAAQLLLRMGEAIETELRDFERARGIYARIESSGRGVAPAWFAIARLAGARGDSAEQRRVLARITEAPAAQITAEQRREALFALAALELGSDVWRDAGVQSLERALSGATDYERAKTALRAAVDRAPDHAALAALFERVARAARDHGMLLEHYERRAARPGAASDEIRDGIELALHLHEYPRAERMLKRLLTSEAVSGESAHAAWAYARLAECRRNVGDRAGAIAFLQQAVDRSQDEAEADALCRELGRLAGELGDLEVAATAYARLLDRDPNIWQALLDIYLRLGDRARFEGFAEECLSRLPLAPDRVKVRLAHARFLIDAAGDERAAVPVLKAALEDDPGERAATDLLTEILQKQGMNEELAELLQTHFDRARDEQNQTAIVELGLRISELYGERRPDAAIDVLRSALSWMPDNAGLLKALLERLGPEAELRERAEVMQALLKVERPAEAARLALQLAPMWVGLSETEHAQQALTLGLRAMPDHAGLRDQLEAFYAEREMWRELGQLLEQEAARLGATAEAVARLKNAASLYRDQLQDLDSAASALRKALAIVPDDLPLLGELARNLAASGQHRTAIDDVSRLLDGHPQTDNVRADLLKVRAELRLAVEELGAAVDDLLDAHALDAKGSRAALIDALERRKTDAFTRGDSAVEREVVMKLVELHESAGDTATACDVLTDWVEQAPTDHEALQALRKRDEALGRLDAVARDCERLAAITTGAERSEAAIAFADACERSGKPDAARELLERLQREDPRDKPVRLRLRALYEALNANAELASILLDDAYSEQRPEARAVLLRKSARLYLEAGDAQAALAPLSEAAKLQPEDAETQLLVVDISIELGQLQRAEQVLEHAINAQKRKRSPELALLYQRLARVAHKREDSEEQLKWLNQAAEIDRKSGEIASELAEAAIAAENYDMAMKALRAITMMEDPKPITRALAFLKQARIAHLRGDPRRAQHWARKAVSLDETLHEADTFLAEIGG